MVSLRFGVKASVLASLLGGFAAAAAAGPVAAELQPTARTAEAAPRPVSQRLRFDSAADLERQLSTIEFEWPPRDVVPMVEVDAFPSDLSSLPVARKKALFFRSLLPVVLAENQRLLQQRRFLLEAFAGRTGPDGADRERLASIQAEYRVEGDAGRAEVQAELLRRVDELPPALVLAQAANESGWGTSRFAREANNLFGMWTYDSRRGLVPNKRNAGARHRVRAYQHLRESVRHYMLTLNRLSAYRELRDLRATQRQAGTSLDAAELAQGLIRYSERGADYVAEIRSMIRSNRLQRIDAVRIQG